MSIPAAFASFKSAGVYRVVYDKSTILNQDTEIMRLVVGYSAQGPFNIPVLVRSISEFKALFGEPSKSLEKRGVYFHRIALQALLEGPILCLNLKRFSDETLYGATIDTTFNPALSEGQTPIDVVELKVEDIFDTTRFWELSAFKLAEIKDVTGKALDGYISLSTTNTKNTSVSFFIRKASGSKVSAYNVTVNDWYKDSGDDVPEFLQDKLSNKVSDFFAEVYIFKGQFTAEQVLTSSTLKNYFESVDEEDSESLKLRPYVKNAYGEPVDTLDALFNDPTSGALSHYVGALIPYFKDKQGVYQALDILVNSDIDTNNVMMNFNVDMLEEGNANIDLSGRANIPVDDSKALSLGNIFAGEAVSTVLGDVNAPVIADEITFKVNYEETVNEKNARRTTGNFYISDIVKQDENYYVFTLKDMKAIDLAPITMQVPANYYAGALDRFGVSYVDTNEGERKYYGGAFCDNLDIEAMTVPEQNIVTITGAGDFDAATGFTYKPSISFAMSPVILAAISNQLNKNADGSDIDNVYGSSVSFIDKGDWYVGKYDGSVALLSGTEGSLAGLMQPGDCLVADDTDENGFYNNVYVQEVGNVMKQDGQFLYFVKLSGTPMTYSAESLAKVEVLTNSVPEWEGKTFYVPSDAEPGQAVQLMDDTKTLIDVWVKFGDPENGIYPFTSYGDAACTQEYATGTAKFVSGSAVYVIRIDAALNQEPGTMSPVYLEGYTYQNSKPASTSMYDKQKWQDFILSTLTDYKGIRTGLLNKSDVDYRYVIDTFESFVTAGCKNVLSFLCKEKQSAFAILNFPAVRTFVKCPYTSFTDSKGIFNVDYVVKGYNPKKAKSVAFTLPSESEGASFCAFYTPLKFSDGYVDTMVPSAGLVSNLFVEKYRSRQPYYIVAGPNYGAITATGMTGPDYNYSREELNAIEPYGVNCMVYRPTFGTFINANQTAKQTPKSALSSVNVRELVIYLQDEIEKLLQSYQWEFNNATVRNKIKDKADIICSRIQSNGGILDFINIMDESNNTPEIIDNEMAVLSTHIEPGRGMGKMIHELTLYRTGQMRAAISEA